MRISHVIQIWRSNSSRRGGRRLRPRPGGLSALLIAALSLALVGCGDQATPDQPGGGDGPAVADPGGAPVTDNPCELLSRDEVASIVGNPVGEGEHFATQCIWHPEVADGTQVKAVLSYVPNAPDADPDDVCENTMAGIPNATPFTGVALGNKAHWSYLDGSRMVGGHIGTMHICTDNAFMLTQVISDRTEAELQQMAIAMATTVLDRV